MLRVITKDGANFLSNKDKLVGSVKSVKSQDVHVPAVYGEYPVFVEQFCSYRMFTYNKKIVAMMDE